MSSTISERLERLKVACEDRLLRIEKVNSEIIEEEIKLKHLQTIAPSEVSLSLLNCQLSQKNLDLSHSHIFINK